LYIKQVTVLVVSAEAYGLIQMFKWTYFIEGKNSHLSLVTIKTVYVVPNGFPMRPRIYLPCSAEKMQRGRCTFMLAVYRRTVISIMKRR
jgi:hypothetical protein